VTYIIGAVELPANTVIERIGETITTNLGRWGKPKGRGVVLLVWRRVAAGALCRCAFAFEGAELPC